MIATMGDGEREDRRPLPYDLLHSIAKEVVGAQSEELDGAIGSALARIGEHFGVASVGLGGVSTNGELMPSLYTWGPIPFKDEALRIPPPGQDLAIQLRREGSVVWNRLEGDELVGKSHSFRTVLRQVEQVGITDSTVLLLGET